MAYEKIYDRLPEIVEAMISLAVGAKVKDPVEGEVYVEAPNFKAGAYLIDRVMGRTVAQTKDLTKERAVDTFEEMVKKLAEERRGAGPGYTSPPLQAPAVIEGEMREITEEVPLPDPMAVEEADKQKAREAVFGG
jgi:hypothetical protein